MPRDPRSQTIFPNVMQMGHFWDRTVRSAFLCGVDPITGQDFEYRKAIIRKRLEHLSSCFAIDVMTFAIMSNHIHQTLRSRPDVASVWTQREVAERWLRINPKKKKDGTERPPTDKEINLITNDAKRVKELRSRLSNFSWWMRELKQRLSWLFNREEGKKGVFWEGRFQHEILADELDVLANMIYVDLNPVRAQIATSIEDSDYTGIKDRIDDLRIYLAEEEGGELALKVSSNSPETHDWERLDNTNSGWLAPIEIDEQKDPLASDPEIDPVGRRVSLKGIFSFSLPRYLELVDFTGRTIRGDKRGAIAESTPAVLKSLSLQANELVARVFSFSKRSKGLAKDPLVAKDPPIAMAVP